MTTLLLIVGFTLAALASKPVGEAAARLRLPLITGYLAAGAVIGPFVLGWISHQGIVSLRVVDNVALAYIAFAAGNELYLKETRSRLKSIAWTTTGLVLSTFTLGTFAVLLAADYIPFMRELGFAPRLGIALMAASIMVARSPSSAIAIVSELRAHGPFTKTALGVTVVMDAVVITVFATSSNVAATLVSGADLDPTFALRVLLDILISVNVGYLVGKLLGVACGAGLPRPVKVAAVLGTGWAVFWSAGALHHFSTHYLKFAMGLEPLLTCMIAGFVVSNYTGFREDFEEVLKSIAPAVYLTFFTLVGASLALDALIKLWPAAVGIFTVRLIGIFIGSYSGGSLSHMPKQHTRLSWMCYVTQAGVGLGLAKSVAVDFPSFGAEFATMIIAAIVVSQIAGPPLFKFALKKVGESHLPALATPDEVRDALILGVDDQALAVAKQLEASNWKVILADVDKAVVEGLRKDDEEGHHIEVHHLAEIDEQSMGKLISRATDAVVTMLGDDDLNYRASEIAYERFGVPRIVVRINDMSWSKRFASIGALMVEPTSAMVNLLDQLVRVPDMATLLMHQDPDHEVTQITVADPDIPGKPLRELRLPPGVRVLGITRDNHAIVPHGNTVLEKNDQVTIIGQPKHNALLASRWGY